MPRPQAPPADAALGKGGEEVRRTARDVARYAVHPLTLGTLAESVDYHRRVAFFLNPQAGGIPIDQDPALPVGTVRITFADGTVREPNMEAPCRVSRSTTSPGRSG
jgi:hypothetical protein